MTTCHVFSSLADQTRSLRLKVQKKTCPAEGLQLKPPNSLVRLSETWMIQPKRSRVFVRLATTCRGTFFQKAEAKRCQLTFAPRLLVEQVFAAFANDCGKGVRTGRMQRCVSPPKALETVAGPCAGAMRFCCTNSRLTPDRVN